MTGDALSDWDRERLEVAKRAFHESMGETQMRDPHEDVSAALLAAIRAAQEVKPPLPSPAEHTRFFRRLDTALRALADPGTDVDTTNGLSQDVRWQDFWLQAAGQRWFIMVRPENRRKVLPLAPAPTRYDSLGQPVIEPAKEA